MGFFDKLDKLIEKAENFVAEISADEKNVYTEQEILNYYIQHFGIVFYDKLLAKTKYVNANYLYGKPVKFKNFDKYYNLAFSEIKKLSSDRYNVKLKGNLNAYDEYGNFTTNFNYDISIKVTNELVIYEDHINLLKK